jgi:hypothetical protein
VASRGSTHYFSGYRSTRELPTMACEPQEGRMSAEKGTPRSATSTTATDKKSKVSRPRNELR